MHRKIRSASLAAFVLFAVAACFRSQPTEVSGRGGGAETTDGQIAAAAGMAQGVQVRLVPIDFDPLAEEALPPSFSAVTDAAGNYAFQRIPAGSYNLEAVQPRDGTRLFLSGIAIGPGRSRTLPKASLSDPGKLRLAWEGGHPGYLYMRGTTLLRRIPASEENAPVMVLDSLPTGRLPPLRWAPSMADTGSPITDSLSILPRDTTNWTVFAAWSHHGAWRLDTASPITEVDGALEDFPMLVRLAASDFDFSQAAPDGRDLRFSDLEGTELPYQIERWDTQAGRGDIRVRMPKVDFGRSGISFHMHWGNAESASRSSGPAVFGADNGYVAVLHLDEAGNSLPGGYADATGSGREGTGISLTGAASASGAIGSGQAMNGIDQWIEIAGEFPTGNAPRSVSLWAKSERPLVPSYLANYGSASDLASFGLWNNAGTWFAWHWGNSNDIETTAKVDTAWHRITLDYDGATTRFYVDGIPVGSDAKILATSSFGFTLGKGYEDKLPWKGLVDEVEVSSVSRSPDWVKFTFETQRPGSTLLRLEILK